jgi:hypothetical protein
LRNRAYRVPMALSTKWAWKWANKTAGEQRLGQSSCTTYAHLRLFGRMLALTRAPDIAALHQFGENMAVLLMPALTTERPFRPYFRNAGLPFVGLFT